MGKVDDASESGKDSKVEELGEEGWRSMGILMGEVLERVGRASADSEATNADESNCILVDIS